MTALSTAEEDGEAYERELMRCEEDQQRAHEQWSRADARQDVRRAWAWFAAFR